MIGDASNIKAALEEAGVEVYREEQSRILIAERIRMHLMDSGIVVSDDTETPGHIRVEFTARCQESDCAGRGSQTLLEVVRGKISPIASDYGFIEVSASRREVRDPVNDARVLDIWHQITYGIDAESAESTVEAVRWALSLDKCVEPE